MLIALTRFDMRHEVPRARYIRMQIGISNPINRDSLGLIVVILVVPCATLSSVYLVARRAF